MTSSTTDTDTRPFPADDASVADRGTDTVPTVSRLESFRRYTYWSMVSAVVVLLLLPAVTGPVPRPPEPVGIASWVGLAVLLAALLPLIGDLIARSTDRRARSTRERRAMLAVAGLASVVVGFTWLQSGADLFWAFPPAIVASVAIAPLSRTRRRLGVVMTMLVAVGAGVAVGTGVAAGLVPGVEDAGVAAASGVYVTPFALFLTLATVWTWDVALQLDDARQQAATLAVANERLRFAADLHDIQGHHLQVIALKSELAGRLVEDDPDTARREIAAVRQLAADALSDTRAVVQGYRRTSLDAEISNATSVLASAGIDARLHLDDDVRVTGLSEDTRHVLGLVVREAVTNVLRHSAATQADISLADDGGMRLRITNDGAREQPTRVDGGLQDLADRVQAAGGVLSWQRDGSRFDVLATLPTDAGAKVTNAADDASGSGS